MGEYMGFGYLFIGYLFMFSFPYRGLDIFPDIIGFIIAFIGIRTLSEYGCGFDNLKRFFCLLIPSSFITLAIQILRLLNIDLSFIEIWETAYTAMILVYNIMLLVAIYRIGKDTGVGIIYAKAQRNLVLCLMYYAIILFFSFPSPLTEKLEVYLATKFSFGLVMYIFGYVWLILNASLIYSCYMWICQIGDEDMPEKESKFMKLKNKSAEE